MLNYGCWTVLSDGYLIGKHRLVKAMCSCGAEKDVRLDHLKSGRSLSCRSCTSTRNAEAWKVWDTPQKKQLLKRARGIRQRCTNSRYHQYKDYGGRGIEFRFESIEEFVEYILRIYPLDSYIGWEIDRYDNNGHYERGNIRLAIHRVNCQNTRRSERYRKKEVH